MIGIIGAMDKEISFLLDQMSFMKQEIHAGKTFYSGVLEGQDVVIVKSGIGKVNATMSAVLLLEKYPIDFVLNTGLAGGLTPTKLKDIVLAEGIAYFDVDLSGIDDVPFGKMGEDPLLVPTDFKLRQKAVYCFEDLEIPFLVGNLVSGDRFVTSLDLLKEIRKEVPHVLAVEMEGMAVALTCLKYGKPFLSIRGISDVIDASDQLEVYQDLSEAIAKETSGFVIRFLEAIDG